MQSYDGRGVTNTNGSRRVGAIVLYSSGNSQGGWYFMSVLTGDRLRRYQWTELPVGSDVIDRVD